MNRVDQIINRVAAYCSECGITLKELARRVGVAPNTARLILKRRGGRIETLRLLSDFVPDDFVEGHGSPASLTGAEHLQHSMHSATPAGQGAENDGNSRRRTPRALAERGAA